MMKKLIEHIDGWRWHDGNTSSMPFEKNSELYQEKLVEGYEVVEMPQAEKDAHTEKESRDQFKLERAQAMQSLTVTTQAGNVFDADETSQTRMSRAITIMDDVDTTVWVLEDNTPIQATKAELKEALRLAGEAQAALWVQA